MYFHFIPKQKRKLIGYTFKKISQRAYLLPNTPVFYKLVKFSHVGDIQRFYICGGSSGNQSGKPLLLTH